MALLSPPLGGLALVHHMGLGAVRPGRDTFQRRDKVVLVGELEHTFLGRRSRSPRPFPSCPAEPTLRPPPGLSLDARSLCAGCALCLGRSAWDILPATSHSQASGLTLLHPVRSK